MAKQSFSVGQVLTAAQMTSLQQTAMLGGSATAKTTSYTLVAADAGTVVSVNSTSATTITVNTGLFAAGDTVTIQNWGSGAVTITAGTATVNTAGSLIVPQYDGGVLYFTSASAAIYFDWVQAGATSPLTTKGDIWGYSTSDARIPVGANDTVLTADSTQALGVKWATPSSGGMSLIQRSSFSNVAGTSTTFDGVCTSTYVTYLVIIENLLAASGADDLQVVLRTSGSDITGNIGNTVRVPYNSATWTNTSSGDVPQITMYTDSVAAAANGQFFINNVGQGFNVGSINGFMYGTSTNSYNLFFGNANTSSVVTGFRLKSASSNITGTVAVYGLAK